MTHTRRRTILLGQRLPFSLWGLVSAVGIFAVLFFLWINGHHEDTSTLIPKLFVLGIILAALHAYLNDGLFVSIVLAVGPLLSFYIPFTFFNWFHPSEDIWFGVGVSLMVGVPAGVIGFGLGEGTQWAVNRLQVIQDTNS